MDIGVNIYLYNPGILHAKTITIDDDLAFFGSSNFDIRSFALNFEINMILYGKKETTELRKAQLRYISKAKQINRTKWENRKIPIKTLQGISKLLSPIL
jgi:cardiolipin synthase